MRHLTAAFLLPMLFFGSIVHAQLPWLPSTTNTWCLAGVWTNDIPAQQFLDLIVKKNSDFGVLSNRLRNPHAEAFPDSAAQLLNELHAIPFSMAETKSGGLLVECRARLILVCMWHAEGTNAIAMMKVLGEEIGSFRERIVPDYRWREAESAQGTSDHKEVDSSVIDSYRSNVLQRELRKSEYLLRRRLFEVGHGLFQSVAEPERTNVWNEVAKAAKLGKEERLVFLKGEKPPRGGLETWPIQYPTP